MPATASVPPWSSARSATGTSSPAGANRIAASSGSGGAASAGPADAAPSSQRELAGLRRAGQHVHRGPLGERDLRHDVRGRAEPVDPEPAARRQLGPLQRAVADDAGAQQRSRLAVAERRGQPVGERLGDHGVLRVAAVGVPAGEPGLPAQVLPAAAAPPAAAAGAAQPRDADPVAEREPGRARAADVDRADDLVAGHGRRTPRRAGRPRPGAGPCGTRRTPPRAPAPRPGPAAAPAAPQLAGARWRSVLGDRRPTHA